MDVVTEMRWMEEVGCWCGVCGIEEGFFLVIWQTAYDFTSLAIHHECVGLFIVLRRHNPHWRQGIVQISFILIDGTIHQGHAHKSIYRAIQILNSRIIHTFIGTRYYCIGFHIIFIR